MSENEEQQQQQLKDSTTHESEWLPPHLAVFKQPPQVPVNLPPAAQLSAQHNTSANAESLSSKVKSLFALYNSASNPVYKRRNAEPTRLKEILMQTIEDNEKAETKPTSNNSFLSQLAGNDTVEVKANMETKAGSNSLLSQLAGNDTVELKDNMETNRGSGSILSQLAGKEIFTYDSPVSTPGLYNSIWAPQNPAEPDPRDEDFSHLFNYKKKKIAREIPEWLRKKIEPTAPIVPKPVFETRSSHLAELEGLMFSPEENEPQEDVLTMDDADDYFNEMGFT